MLFPCFDCRQPTRTCAKPCSARGMPKSEPSRAGVVHGVAVAQAEVGLHGAGGLAAGAHRLDHGGGARDDVAAGPDARDRGREVVVGRDVAPLVEFELRRLAEDRIGVGADREHDHVGLELEFAARHDHRTTASGFVGLAEFHPHAAQRADPVAGVAEDLDRGGQPVEVDPFLLGVMDLLDPRRRFLLASGGRCSARFRRRGAARRAAHPWRCCRRR